jgi:hypothetical protein
MCLVMALCMDQHWAEQHFLPVWTWSWTIQLRIVLVLRLLLASLGLLTVFLLRPWLVQACAEQTPLWAFGQLAGAALAIVAALLATEFVLRTQTWRAAQEQWNLEEPLRIRDPEYGWSLAPDHAGKIEIDGRLVRYATGPFGYRVSRAGLAPDFKRPTILFAGESIIFGYGLNWSETIPAQVQERLKIQTVNMAVNAHATDQIYLRLRRELPRFAHPMAVVIPFMPRLLDRNLDSDKPHLDDRLRWQPAGPPPLRLVELTRRMLRYRDPGDIARSEATTSKVLKAAIAAAEARGAQAIVLVPQYVPEEAVERRIRIAVLDRAGIPYLLVPIPKEWRSPTNYHPTAAGAATLADALARHIAAVTRMGD